MSYLRVLDDCTGHAFDMGFKLEVLCDASLQCNIAVVNYLITALSLLSELLLAGFNVVKDIILKLFYRHVDFLLLGLQTLHQRLE